jgi:2-polyprenyl-3-methyl-5-hydroxy-6-metoxy-1,4-benzoquinol methylase
MSDPFGEEYWHEASHYRRFEDYATGLRQTRRWYVGLLRLIGRYLPPSGRHLDAGCGHGAIVHLMLDRGFDAYGMDRSRYIVEQAQAFAPHLAGRFSVGTLGEDAPFGGGFGVITCFEVLEHVDDPDAVLDALAGMLAPSGRLIATTPNPANRFPYYDPTVSDPTHVSLHPPAWWEEALRRSGLVPLRVSTFWSVPLAWRLHSALSLSVPTGAHVGPGTLLVAERAGVGGGHR